MSDVRMRRLAELLVNYSTQVKPGEWVMIFGDVGGMPLMREVAAAVVRAGANPSFQISDETTTRMLMREGSDNQVAWLEPSLQKAIDEADVWVNIRAIQNTRGMTNIDNGRIQLHESGKRAYYLKQLTARTAVGKLRWVLTEFPTVATAQEANMSQEELEDFIYRTTFCDKDDPVAQWQRISAEQQRLVEYMRGKKHVTLKGANIDLSLSIEGRTFMNADGTRNMPDGEIFTGPVEHSVNGWARYSNPTNISGKVVEGIELRFQDGKVVEATAQHNQDLLLQKLNTDEGARYLGEFAIGTNYGIDRFTGNILFDEKIGGTIHTAVGASYPETGGVNTSKIHWDMICEMRGDSEIHVDGELIYKDGHFVV